LCKNFSNAPNFYFYPTKGKHPFFVNLHKKPLQSFAKTAYNAVLAGVQKFGYFFVCFSIDVINFIQMVGMVLVKLTAKLR